MRRQTSTYRQIATSWLGLALLAPVLYSLHFYGERLTHRMYMWYEAKHENLETFVVDSATIQWTKKNRELIINGEYFDLVSVNYLNGKATVKGFFDHKETEMHIAFAVTSKKNNDNGDAAQKLADLLQTGWLQNGFEISVSHPLILSTDRILFPGQFFPFRIISIPHPPPWFAA
jgi:hypothetical protein